MALPFEVARFDALKKLAVERFGEITPAEEGVLRLSASTEDVDPPGSEDRPEVRAAFLRWLATDKGAAPQIDSLGLRVQNATITSTLNLSFCKIPFPLVLRDCAIQGNLRLRSAELSALHILSCRVEEGISASGLRTQGDIFLHKLEANGELRFLGACIGGSLNCSGATLTAKGRALSADKAEISGDVFLKEGFSASGEIRFLGARIGGDLDCCGAALTFKGDALSADKVNINGNAFLNEKFSSSGELRFPNAEIGGVLDCSGATLTAEGNALIADGSNITGGVVLTEKFSCSGTIRLVGAQISGDLDCSGARIWALVCEHMQLRGNLIWTALRDPKNSYLNLLGASVKTLRDDTASWPSQGKFAVGGLEYADLVSHEPSTEEHLSNRRMALQRTLDAVERIAWLNLQGVEDRLDPQPWMWLAQLFKEKDNVAGYRRVICEYRCMKARARRNPIARTTGVGMAHLERNPWRILWLFLPLLLLGSLVFWASANAGYIPPTSADAYLAWQSGRPFPIAYPRFNPLVYTLESELPLVRFGMDDKWAPDPNLIARGNTATYWGLAVFRWFLILAGWLQGILLTYGITRRFRD